MIMNPIYKRLHEYIILNGICQKAVAVDAGITQAKLSQLLNGRRRLMMEDYMRICRALERDPGFFLTPSAPPQPFDEEGKIG